MEKHLDVMRRTVELAATCLEGIEHIRIRVNKGYFEDTIQLLQDFVHAVYQMEKSIQPIVNELPPNQLEEFTTLLRDAIDLVVSAYEKGEGGKALEIIQFNLLPSYKKWQSELERCLNPFILS